MNDTQRRLIKFWQARAEKEYKEGNIRQGDRSASNALTFSYPIGLLICQTLN